MLAVSNANFLFKKLLLGFKLQQSWSVGGQKTEKKKQKKTKNEKFI